MKYAIAFFLDIFAALLLVIAGCSSTEGLDTPNRNSPNGSASSTDLDELVPTGTLVLDGTQYEVRVGGTWTTYTDPNCKSAPLTLLHVVLEGEGEQRKFELTVTLWFDADTLPPMPIDVSSYQYECDGTYGAIQGGVSLLTITEGESNQWAADSGTLSLTPRFQGDNLVEIEGEFSELSLQRTDGTTRLTLSGNFIEMMDRVDGITPEQR